MSASPVFEWLCGELSKRTSIEMLQARGLVRFVLQRAGVEPRTLSKVEALVVVERLLPRELDTRRVANGATVCNEIVLVLKSTTFTDAGPESAESAFARLGRK
jgi:hypothetical protein